MILDSGKGAWGGGGGGPGNWFVYLKEAHTRATGFPRARLWSLGVPKNKWGKKKRKKKLGGAVSDPQK